MIDSGYILVDRGVWSHPALDTDDPMSPREAWIRLVGEAAFKDHAGLKRGQLRIGMRGLAAIFGWLTSAGEPDKERVRTFLRKLERHAMIQRSNGVTTIVNYDRWQARDRSEIEQNQASQNGHPPSHPVATPRRSAHRGFRDGWPPRGHPCSRTLPTPSPPL